jgi:hypothetical protein
VTRSSPISSQCLPTSAYTPGPALSGVQGFRDQTVEVLLSSSQIASVTVLDSRNRTSVAGMVTGMTTIDGYVPFAQTVVRISPPASPSATLPASSSTSSSTSAASIGSAASPTARLEQVTQDQLRLLGALRYASSLVQSGDKKHIYSVDFATDSITTVALLSSTPLAERGAFVDRRRHGEERSRLMPEELITGACPAGAEAADASSSSEALQKLMSESVPPPSSDTSPPPTTVSVAAGCGMSEVVVGDMNLVAIGTGCHDLSQIHVMGDREDKEKESTSLKFDRPSLSPCVDLSSAAECASVRERGSEPLWEATVGWWVFGSSSLFSSYTRARNGAGGCQEKYVTHVEPSSFRNLRQHSPSAASSGHSPDDGLLGAAVLQGPICKDQDWDRPHGHQLSAHNILIAHGEMQAAQFDGVINAGLIVAQDAGTLVPSAAMPVHALTAESWITINTRSLSYGAILAAQRSGSTSSPADSPLASGLASRTNLRGWSLGYSVSTSSAVSRFVFFFVLRSPSILSPPLLSPLLSSRLPLCVSQVGGE